MYCWLYAVDCIYLLSGIVYQRVAHYWGYLEMDDFLKYQTHVNSRVWLEYQSIPPQTSLKNIIRQDFGKFPESPRGNYILSKLWHTTCKFKKFVPAMDDTPRNFSKFPEQLFYRTRLDCAVVFILQWLNVMWNQINFIYWFISYIFLIYFSTFTFGNIYFDSNNLKNIHGN